MGGQNAIQGTLRFFATRREEVTKASVMTHVTFTLVSSSAICILLSKFSGLVMRKKPSFSIEFDIIGKMKQKMDMDQ